MKEKIQFKKIAKMTVIASPNYDQIRVYNAQRESWFQFTFTIKRQNTKSTEWWCSVHNKTDMPSCGGSAWWQLFNPKDTPACFQNRKIAKEVSDDIFLIIVIIIIIKVVKDLAILLWTIVFLVIIIICYIHDTPITSDQLNEVF
jgi:hypothetical protein